MLVKCPRCGFSQPKDQYCAQCGVDMVTYKPPKVSPFKKYSKDPVVYLGLLLVAIGLFLANNYRHQKMELTQRVNFLKGNLQIASTSGTGVKKSQPSPASVEAPPPPAATVAHEAPAAAPAAEAAKAVAPTTSTGPTVRIYYAEVSVLALKRLYEISQATGQFNVFGDYSAGLLPDLKSRLNSPALRIQALPGETKDVAKELRWFAGLHDAESGDDIGLTTFMSVDEVENNTYRGSLEVLRSWRDGTEQPANSIQKTSFPATFEMTPGDGFFIDRVLPHNTHILREDEFSAIRPAHALDILKSLNFQNRESELVIFVEFEKKP